MNFQLTEKQASLQSDVNAFCAEYCDKDVAYQLATEKQFPTDIYKALSDQGLLKTPIAKKYGGKSGGLIETVLVTEELAKHSGTLGNIFLVNTVFCGALIQMAGSDRQQAELLPGLAEGKLRFCFALTEQSAGSDASAVTTHATKNADGWSISGSKKYATGALDADWLLIVARSDTQCKPTEGLSIFIVPAQSENLTIEPLDKIAGNAFASCSIDLNDVRVPHSAILGEDTGLHKAWSALRVTGGMERICVAAYALGIAQAVNADAQSHAKERHQFGQPIGKFQAIQHKLAEMTIQIEAAKWLTYAAAWKVDNGDDAAKEISIAKIFASQALNDIVMHGSNIFGGEGFLSNSAITRYRNEALLTIYAGGTTEIQKNLIARYIGL